MSAQFTVFVTLPGTADQWSGRFEGEAIAGRLEECDVHLAHPLVSRRHAAFSRTEEGDVVIRDLGSTNGTIAENSVLRGDEIRVRGRAAAHIGPFLLVISADVEERAATLRLDSPASVYFSRIAFSGDGDASDPTPSGPPYPEGLSGREVEVLRLVAAGHTNPEIAEELVISPNTVARHLTHIFNKTGTTNRVEATVYAFRHRLTKE